MKKPSYQQLEQIIKDLKAQSAYSTRSALQEISKADDRLMASACVIHLTALGGREIINPVAIRDGLSAETIQAIKNDIRRTMALSKFNE